MTVLMLIQSFWGICQYISVLFGVPNLVNQVATFYSNSASYQLELKTFIGYVYFFFDKNQFLPLLTVTISLLTIRCASAIINLIWW